jgi:hypothetical protein
MSNVAISGLPVAVALTGAELVEIVQAGGSYRTTTGAIAALAALSGGAGLITGIALSPILISALPAAPLAGMFAYISNGAAGLAWGAVATTTTGSTPYLVWYNGTSWTVVGK